MGDKRRGKGEETVPRMIGSQKREGERRERITSDASVFGARRDVSGEKRIKSMGGEKRSSEGGVSGKGSRRALQRRERKKVGWRGGEIGRAAGGQMRGGRGAFTARPHVRARWAVCIRSTLPAAKPTTEAHTSDPKQPGREREKPRKHGGSRRRSAEARGTSACEKTTT